MNADVIPLQRKAKKFVQVEDAKGRPIKGLFRYVPTGVIYYKEKFKKLGIPPFFGPTGETTVGRAKTKVQLLINQHKNKHLGIDDSQVFGRKSTRTFGSIAEEVLLKVTPTRRRKTQVQHRYHVGKAIDRFGNWDINSITVTAFEDWISDMRRKGERSTFMDFAKHMNLVMRYAYNYKFATHLLHFANPDKSHAKPGRVYTDEEIKALWDVMNNETKDQFVLSYECMMRLREVLYLTWDRVDLKSGRITLRPIDVKTGSRTGRGREFLASEHALTRLRERFKKRNPRSPYVFPSPRTPSKPVDQNKTAWRNAKVESRIKEPRKATWHSLRHTALTKALLVTCVDPLIVSEYAGVSLQTIQRVYLHSKAEMTKKASASVSIPIRGKQGVNGNG